jgi:hypothetical protein
VRWTITYNSSTNDAFIVSASFYPCRYILAGQTIPVYPLIDRPDTWPVNQEIDFGGGLKGRRMTGSITTTTTPNTDAIIATGLPTNMVLESYEGVFGANTPLPWFGASYSGVPTTAFVVGMSSGQVAIRYTDTAAHTLSYDVRIKYHG